MTPRWMKQSIGLLMSLLLLGASMEPTHAAMITVDISCYAGPWNYVDGGLNTTFQYGINDHISPVVISGSDGFDFAPGGSFTIEYLSGLTSPYGDRPPYADANGDPNGDASDNPGSSGRYFPSLYFNPSDYPTYLNALVGTFADGSGAIVGTPFKIGLGRTVTAPVGVTALQLGINDDIFSDNLGSLTAKVMGPSIPEPGSMALLGTGLIMMTAYAGRRIRFRRRA